MVSKLIHSMGLHAEIFDTAEEFRRLCPKTGVVLAHHHSIGPGAAALSKILPKGMFYPVILYSDHPGIDTLIDSMLEGALGYLSWPITVDALSTSVNRLRSSAVSSIRRQRRHVQCREQLAVLTEREKAVLACLMQNCSNKETGLRLGISFRTVEIHRANILKKLEAPTIAAVTRIAVYAEFEDE